MQPHVSTAPMAWAEVLENVEKTLAEAEAEAARSEPTAPDGPDAAPPAPPWHKSLDRLAERFRQLQGCIAEAELNATQAEKSLLQSEQALQRWQMEAAAMRQKLANEAVPSVS